VPPLSPCSLAWLAAACLLAIAGCGARTSLEICESIGATRACQNECGSGAQECNGGVWTPCFVAPTTRSCTNACGSGTQACTEGAWSACAVPDTVRTCDAPCGPGQQTCTKGAWQGCVGPQPHAPTLQATVRNFEPTDPDFEPDGGSRTRGSGPTTGIVAPLLADDGTPVYSGPTIGSTHGAALFYDWYHDVPGVNESVQIPIAFMPEPNDPTIDGFDQNFFFPVDGMLFGNEGPHNYYFTMQLATFVLYGGGETYRFSCDDDCWVFLNRTLALDLGGLHSAYAGSIDLDSQSATLGLVKGNRYPLDVFYADRHVVSAVLHMDITAADIATCDP
jgi:fibro-slime domain-containing protein